MNPTYYIIHSDQCVDGRWPILYTCEFLRDAKDRVRSIFDTHPECEFISIDEMTYLGTKRMGETLIVARPTLIRPSRKRGREYIYSRGKRYAVIRSTRL